MITPSEPRLRTQAGTGHEQTRAYEAPLIYDVAFSFRDYRAETDVLEQWYRRVSGRAQIDSVLELACGPSVHALELVRRGAAATGIDISAAMCAYARAKAEAMRLPLEIVCQDMVDFELGKKFDLAILLLSSVAHIYTLDAFTKHLSTVARHLHPHGVYVIEMAHPSNFLGRSDRPPGIGVAIPWKVSRDGLDLEVQWGRPDDPYDPITQIFQASVEIRVRDGKSEQLFQERCPMRDWTFTELQAVLKLNGDFELAEVHGDFTPDAVFDNSEESWRMMVVLRRSSRRV